MRAETSSEAAMGNEFGVAMSSDMIQEQMKIMMQIQLSN